MNPYIQFLQPQDIQGLTPVFQNIATQQANQNDALQQQMQNNQMAGQVQGSGMGGLNPLAMAAMLRNKKPDYDQWKTTGDNTYFGANSNGMGAGQGYAGMNAELGL